MIIGVLVVWIFYVLEWHVLVSELKEESVIGKFTKFNENGGNKSTFSFKVFAGMSDALYALLMSSLFNSFATSSIVAVLKEKWMLPCFKVFSIF